MKYYLCVTPFFPSPDNWRGAYVLDQVKAIKRNSDYEVLVFIGGGKNAVDYEIEGIKVYYYKSFGLPSNILNGMFNDYDSKSFVKKVLDLGIDPIDVDFVHCHVSMRGACGLALKKLNPNIKVLLQHHDLDPFNLRSGVVGRNNRFNIRYRAKKAIDIYNQVDLHICISEACRDSLLSFPVQRNGEVFEDYLRVLRLCKGLQPIQPKATYVLYNGVDCSMFRKCNKEQNKDKFVIGCIANFQELKGHITLIKAFELLHKAGYNNVYLSLLGTGETRQVCEDYIKEHNLQQYVEWPKEVTHNELPDYYHSLDLFVLPSYFEGFGCVYTEAAACGVPFMGCINQGYSEYILEDDKENWLVKWNDFSQLSKIIERYIQKRENQKLRYSFDIHELINGFLCYLDRI